MVDVYIFLFPPLLSPFFFFTAPVIRFRADRYWGYGFLAK